MKKEVQSLESSCVLDSAPLWAGSGRASLYEVTGRIMVPGRGKGEEVTMKHFPVHSCLSTIKNSVSREGNLAIPGH